MTERQSRWESFSWKIFKIVQLNGMPGRKSKRYTITSLSDRNYTSKLRHTFFYFWIECILGFEERLLRKEGFFLVVYFYIPMKCEIASQKIAWFGASTIDIGRENSEIVFTNVKSESFNWFIVSYSQESFLFEMSTLNEKIWSFLCRCQKPTLSECEHENKKESLRRSLLISNDVMIVCDWREAIPLYFGCYTTSGTNNF